MRDVADMLKDDIAKSNAKRDRNREAFPAVAQMVDELSKTFGPIRVLWASEGGKEIGKKQEF